MPPRPASPILVFDANVLIDYWRGNRALLRLISTAIAPIVIPTEVFDEVGELTDRHCRTHQIQVVDLSIEEMTIASQERGGLSLADRLCLALAKKHPGHCVTNDVALRRECLAENVAVLWGLEPLSMLVDSQHISGRVARRTVMKMREANPRYITQKIVSEFLNKIGYRSLEDV